MCWCIIDNLIWTKSVVRRTLGYTLGGEEMKRLIIRNGFGLAHGFMEEI